VGLLVLWGVGLGVVVLLVGVGLWGGRLAREFRKRLPEIVTRAPEMPSLMHAWLEQQVEGRHELAMRSAELAELARAVREAQRRLTAAILGVGALVALAVLYALR
jgi:ubiquinone biosynthesis protein